jgi:hypothetical protein
MTAGQKVLAAVIVLVVACGVVDSIGGHVFASAVSGNRGLSRLDVFVVQWHMAMLRYAPLVVLPVLVAPLVVLVIWLVPGLRPRRLESAPAEARVLAAWLAWFVGVPILGVAIGSTCAALGVSPAPGVSPWLPATAVVLVFGVMGWSYTAALHRSFRLHRRRVADGSSHIGTGTFAAFAAVAALVWPLGVLLPFWMLWRAKRDRVSFGGV